MQESTFVGIFEEAARSVLGASAVVKRGECLYYSLSLDRRLQLSTPNTRTPVRGSSAFQTDICICESLDGIDFPRIVIEFKERITTHDILTYSAKAGKHKQIYRQLSGAELNKLAQQMVDAEDLSGRAARAAGSVPAPGGPRV